MQVKVSLDSTAYYDKETAKNETRLISKRIAGLKKEVSIAYLADKVGNCGYTFCPTIFKGLHRKESDFYEIQLFGIDIDSGTVYEKIKEKADKYGLPISFSYHTFSSDKTNPRYRIIFTHMVPIYNKDVAQMMLEMFKVLFPEADKSCFELSRMFFGGKELIEVNEEAVFGFNTLCDKFQEELYVREPTQYNRNIKIFARKHDVGLNNRGLDIRTYKYGTGECGKNVKKTGNNIKYVIELPQITTKIVIGSYIEKTTSDVPTGYVQKRNMLEHIKEDVLCDSCRLYKDFKDGKDIPHNSKFLLVTNLRFLKGYRKKFFEYIGTYSNTEEIDRWKYQWNKINDEYEYKPKSCNKDDCPYYDKCMHNTNIVLKVKGRRNICYLEEPEYLPLKDVEKKTEEAIYDALNSKDSNIHLIKAQTGIGKTSIYIDIIKRSSEKFIVAVPTVILKNEIVKKLNGYAEGCISIKDLLLPEYIIDVVKSYYERGLYKEGKQLIADYAKTVPEGYYERKKLDAYINYEDQIKKHNKSLVMTHAQLLNLKPEDTLGYNVIIDEDILLTIMRDIRSIKIEDISTAVGNGLINCIKANEFKKIIGMNSGYYKAGAIDEFSYISEEKMDEVGIGGDINGLFRAGSYYVSDDKVSYFVPKQLSKQKIIIMSATLNVNMYKSYFKDREVTNHPVPLAKYEGELVQYSFYSMSRKNMEELKDKGWDTNRIIDKIIDSVGGRIDYGISFKANDRILKEKFNSEPMHFGNSAGTNIYNGKNGLIVGTPHLKEESYKLIACYLGENVNKEDCEIRRREVLYNGFKFNIMSYSNEVLREIQLYMISSELEQSIGRSRLLRNDAKVYVFSNFPCMQAILHQEDYLSENKKENFEVVEKIGLRSEDIEKLAS